MFSVLSCCCFLFQEQESFDEGDEHVCAKVEVEEEEEEEEVGEEVGDEVEIDREPVCCIRRTAQVNSLVDAKHTKGFGRVRQ